MKVETRQPGMHHGIINLEPGRFLGRGTVECVVYFTGDVFSK